MRKDLKTGILVGAAVVIASVAAMSVWPGQSVESRLRQSLASGDDETTDEVVPTGQEQAEPPGAEPEPVEERRVPVEQLDEGATVEVEEIRKRPVESPRVEEKRETQIHVVAGGETLSSISVMYYGSGSQWRKIVDANPKVITDEDRLQPGMRLVIPR